ncbi:MAG: DNA-primase RepB domain-containing protein [Vicinamibacterales bacterium]
MRFLQTAFGREDSIALLLKNSSTSAARQRICRRDWLSRDAAWHYLRRLDDAGHNIYVGVNSILPDRLSRTRRDIATVRHVFLDADDSVPDLLRFLDGRPNLPPPSYVLHSSVARAHLFWRVRDFNVDDVERLQKNLALEAGTDPAATAATQMTRLPGFRNHKYHEPHIVWVDYLDIEHVYTPRDFPSVHRVEAVRREPALVRSLAGVSWWGRLERAGAYLSRVPPAVSGQHGDLHTFQTCCRIVRGFALDDDQALAVLAEWNARCQPPWTERELLQKIRSARRNGREPIGGLL